MTVDRRVSVEVTDPPALRELAGMLREVTGEGAGWASRIMPQTRIEDDLQLESVELAALGELVRRRFGVDLSAFLSALDFDELIALTVGDLLTLLANDDHGRERRETR